MILRIVTNFIYFFFSFKVFIFQMWWFLAEKKRSPFFLPEITKILKNNSPPKKITAYDRIN
jgi:hypothetical protein